MGRRPNPPPFLPSRIGTRAPGDDGKKPRGRPPKYHTEEERREARRIIARDGKRRRNAERRACDPRLVPWAIDIVSDRPPDEVLRELDYRLSLPTPDVGPPAPYAGHYYVQAWRVQQQFAREI